MAANNNGAEQFSAFAALTGFDDIIREHEFICEQQRELSDDSKEIISEKLSKVRKGMTIQVTFYDNRRYTTIKGIVKDIDCIYQIIRIDNRRVVFDDLTDIELLDE